MEQQESLPLIEPETKYLRGLIAKGESIEVEFKDDKNISDSNIVEAVVSMTNTNGGTLFVGVSNRKEILGSHRLSTGYWKGTEAIAGMIMANTWPPCATGVSAVTFENNKTVVVIKIPKAPTTTGTKSGRFLKRSINSKGEPEDLPMSTDDIVNGITRVGVQDFSATVLADASTEDLDLELVSETAKRRSTQITDPFRKELFLQSPREILTITGLLSPNDAKPNIAALLIFGRTDQLRNRLPNHEIQYQIFGPGGEILKNSAYVGPIARVFPKLLELPELSRISDEFRFRGSNVVIPEYPEDSRREALANAIVHRDYTYQSSIQIQLYERELIITNPGAFPLGISLNNLLSAAPTPRNRKLTEAMREFGFVESSGRGIDFIFQGQARFGRPAPDYSASDSYRVTVRLTGGKANLDFCRLVLSTLENPSVSELLILNALFVKRNLTTDQLAAIIQRPPTITQEILSKLKEEKLIEMTSGRTPSYLLKGSVNHSAMKAVKPARLGSQQMSQFKQDLLTELQREAPNTVSALADCVGLSPSQTRRLLIQLRNENRVTMLPGKKWKLP